MIKKFVDVGVVTLHFYTNSFTTIRQRCLILILDILSAARRRETLSVTSDVDGMRLCNYKRFRMKSK